MILHEKHDNILCEMLGHIGFWRDLTKYSCIIHILEICKFSHLLELKVLRYYICSSWWLETIRSRYLLYKAFKIRCPVVFLSIIWWIILTVVSNMLREWSTVRCASVSSIQMDVKIHFFSVISSWIRSIWGHLKYHKVIHFVWKMLRFYWQTNKL